MRRFLLATLAVVALAGCEQQRSTRVMLPLPALAPDVPALADYLR